MYRTSNNGNAIFEARLGSTLGHALLEASSVVALEAGIDCVCQTEYRKSSQRSASSTVWSPESSGSSTTERTTVDNSLTVGDSEKRSEKEDEKLHWRMSPVDGLDGSSGCFYTGSKPCNHCLGEMLKFFRTRNFLDVRRY